MDAGGMEGRRVKRERKVGIRNWVDFAKTNDVRLKWRPCLGGR